MRPLLLDGLRAAQREERRATWALTEALHVLERAVDQGDGVADALAAVRRAEVDRAQVTALRTRLYQEILNTTPSEVR